MRYNKTWLRYKFPKETAYITVLREPFSHLKSCMRFYSLPKLLNITSTNPIKTFLQDPWKYKSLSEAYFSYCNLTWDGTRNHMAFDLGYPTEGADDMAAAKRYIKELEYDFTLVLLLEHLDESLVLLRRLMCWEMQDVVYDSKPSNYRNYVYKSYAPTTDELANLRKWKAVDYLLYDTFNRSLWRKIAAQGQDFFRELSHFKELKKNISLYCHRERKGPNLPFTMEASKWSRQFVVDANYCRALKKSAPIPLGWRSRCALTATSFWPERRKRGESAVGAQRERGESAMLAMRAVTSAMVLNMFKTVAVRAPRMAIKNERLESAQRAG
ncbi:GAL3ST3 [Branchiostoma lanceolatum]|uniref:GAL3ST3 protein n=1 Tax=Branchiostoma lanceolatum TaxID=7740 RepID=A0A8K0AB83_BRALA|nr:GAL3ST3 [Branchiostoma lanceolatum]